MALGITLQGRAKQLVRRAARKSHDSGYRMRCVEVVEATELEPSCRCVGGGDGDRAPRRGLGRCATLCGIPNGTLNYVAALSALDCESPVPKVAPHTDQRPSQHS